MRFLRVLASLITQRRAALLPKDEPTSESVNGSELIGWYDTDFLNLIPEASHKVVSRFCQETGEPLSTGLERLKKDLSEEKISESDQGRLTATVWIGGKTKRVLKLRIAAINGLLEEDFPL